MMNGLCEPLGRSQVLPYLINASKIYKITIVSLEKDPDSETYKSIIDSCRKNKITWKHGTFSSAIRYISTLSNILKLFLLAISSTSKKYKHEIIHCRSYLSSFIGLLLKLFKRKKIIFDIRGLWIDELVAGKKIRINSFSYRLLRKLEKRIFINSDHVVTLTNASKDYIINRYLIREDKVTVIPTCVDHKVFYEEETDRNHVNKIGFLGTLVSGWFNLKLMHKFINVISKELPSYKFEIISSDTQDQIYSAFDKESLNIRDFNIDISYVDRSELREKINSLSFLAMFYNANNVCEIARSPTKIGEALACGLPIMINSGIGDVDQLVSKFNIGVVLESNSSDEIALKTQKLLDMISEDNNTKKRCVETSQEIYSLNKGSQKYLRIYDGLCGPK